MTEKNDKKWTREERRKAQQMTALFVEQTPLAVIEWNTDFEVVEWNPAAERIFGYTRAEAIGRHAIELIVPESAREHAGKIWEDLLSNKGGGRSSNENVTKDGNAIFCQWYNTPLVNEAGEVIGIASLAEDVTERKQAEDKLKLLGEITTNMAEGVCLVRTSDAVIVYANPKFEEMFGYATGELAGNHVSIVNAPCDKSPDETAIEIASELRKRGVWSGEIFNRKKDGTSFWCYVNTSTFDHPEYGEIWVAVHSDITDRKWAQEALNDSVERYRNLVETTSDWVWEVDENGVYTYVSPKIKDFLGYEVEEVFGKVPFDFMSGEEAKRVAAVFKPIVEKREPFNCLESTNLHKNGNLVVLETSGVPIFDNNGDFKGYRGMDCDITERKRVEERIALLNKTFLEFGPDPEANIQCLTGLCGGLMDATCALYNRLEGDQLCSIGLWQTPPGFNPIDSAEGHICHDVIKDGKDEVVLIRNLPDTSYFESDISVKNYGLKTYMGHTVRCGNEYVGSICAVFQSDFVPTEEDKSFISIIASAIGVEEARARANEEVRKFLVAVEQSPANIVITDVRGNIEYVNPWFTKLTGYTFEDVVGQNPKLLNTGHITQEQYKEMWQTISSGNVWHGEFLNKKKNGELYWEDAYISPVKDHSDRITHYIAVKEDITERKQAEKDRRLFRNLINQSSDSIFVINPQTGDFIDVNDRVCESLLYTREELLGMNVADVRGGLSDDSSWDKHVEELREKGSLTVESDHNRKDGTVFPVEVNVKYVHQDESDYIVAVARDTTERRKAAGELAVYREHLEELVHERTADLYREMDQRARTVQELKESQRSLSTLMSNLPGMAYRCRNDKNWTMEFISEGCFDLTGYQQEELVNNSKISFSELIHEDDGQQVWDDVQAALEKKEPFQLLYRITTRDGDEKWVWEQGIGVFSDEGELQALEGFVIDITERKRGEDAMSALVESTVGGVGQEFFDSTVRALAQWLGADCVVIGEAVENNNINAISMIMNGEMVEHFSYDLSGTPCSEVTSKGFCFYPENVAGSFPEDKYLVNMNAQSYMGLPLFDREGKTIGVLCAISSEKMTLPPKGREVFEIVASRVSVEIERIRSEQAREESEERVRLLLDSTAEAIYGLDLDGNCTFANPACLKMLGYGSVNELFGKDMHALVHHTQADGSHSPTEHCAVQSTIDNNEGIHEEDMLLWRKDGTSFPAELWAYPISMKEKVVGAVVTFLDVTERQRTQEEILKTQKLKSVALLAAGIAHDFNNLLASIIGNIGLVKLSMPPEHKRLREMLEKSEKTCLRAGELTNQLLTFARGGAPIKKTVNIGEVVRESVEIVLRGSSILGNAVIPDGLTAVKADEGQVSQVINNLIINAKQAMPDGGIVVVECENVEFGEGSAATGLPSGLKPGKYVRTTVKDEGPGMDEEVLRKIFDPYFTTKETGSGLGLATAYSIIKKHEGLITAESKLGVGSTFYVYLPATEKQIDETDDPGKELYTGTGRVLVLEDEDMVGDFVSELLKSSGYEPFVVKDGEQAVEEYRAAMKAGEPFSAVLADLTIKGGMGGKEAVEKLIGIDPAVRAIVTSGYSNDPVLANYAKYGFKEAVAKPYKALELSKVLHEVINGVVVVESDIDDD